MVRDEKPNYSDVIFSGVRAMFSKRYLESALRNAAAGCPALEALEPELYKRLADNEFKRLRAVLRVLRIILVLTIVYAIVITRYANTGSARSTVVVLIGPVIILIIEIVLLIPTRRRLYEFFASRRLFIVIRLLEKNVTFWDDTDFRKHIAARIQRAAVAIEGIPLGFSGIAPEVRRELFANSRSKGQAMRSLELLAIKPTPTTYSDLIQRLTSDLANVLRGQWYELPDAEGQHRVSRGLFALQVGGAVLSVGGLVAVIAFASKLGSVASILATALSIVTLALLNRAGLPTGIVERYADAGAQLIPKDD